MSTTAAADALRHVRSAAAAGDGPALADVPLRDAGARVAWSAVAEPGDAVAGVLVRDLGPATALTAVGRALDVGPTELVELAVDRGVVPTDAGSAFAETIGSALGRWRPRLESLDLAAILGAARGVGARLVLPGDDDWPRRFDDLGPHAPTVLWARGPELPIGGPVLADDVPTLAVVGSRADTVGGAETAAEITSRAVDGGCTIVSGGAYGIDAVAHRVSIAADAPSVAFLAGGVDQLYPAGHTDMLRSLMRRGTVLAETPPGTRPTRWRFLARNRLIAAAADAVVVVEAGARSGALNTAHHAAELGRTVLAVPGPLHSPASVGCHRLVASGRAEIVVSPDDPVRAVRAARGPGVVDRTPTLSGAAEDPGVVRVLDALQRRRPLGIEEVARRAGMSIADATDALALAELEGIVRRELSGWRRVG